MARLNLPMVGTTMQRVYEPGERRGTAYRRTRDAYHDVPILKKPTWGHDIAAYFYFGGISAGAEVLGSVANIVGGQHGKTLARTAHYVALVALLPCPPFLIADLGRPSRFHHMLRIVKPSSPMNLGAWTLTLHGAMATLAVGRTLAAEDRLPAIGPLMRLLPEDAVAAAALPSALTLGGYTGVLLGTTSVPVWFTSPLLGALFMASSLSTGAAAVSLVSAVTGREDPASTASMDRLEIVFGMTELFVLGGYIITSGKAARPLLRGLIGLMMAGTAASLVAAPALQAVSLLSPRRRRPLTLGASVITLVGGALLRWAVVFAGKPSATDREGTLEAMTPSRKAPGWQPRTRPLDADQR